MIKSIVVENVTEVEENIAEIAMYVGAMIKTGKIDKENKDLPSSEMSLKIVKWAKEFEKIDRSEFYKLDAKDQPIQPFTYLDAIDSFTENKCKEAGWFNKE